MQSPARFYSSLSSLPRFLRLFSSTSSPAWHEHLSFFAADGGGPVGESPAYRRSMLRRPEAVRPKVSYWNSCSFIGSVVSPLRRYATRDDNFGVYTFLKVTRPSRDSDHSSFEILLAMWNEMAEVSVRHLKPNDFIYVSGPLSSYGKVNASGKHDIFQTVVVKDLNYVKRTDQDDQVSQNPESSDVVGQKVPASSVSDEETASTSAERDYEVEHRDHLHLWQVFFANPHEWWDNRQGKRYPKQPDFKHKDTRECLWLSPSDPPWVRKQLQLYDSKMTGIGQRNPNGPRSRVYEWEFKDSDLLF